MSGLVVWIWEGVLGLCFAGHWSLAVWDSCFDALVAWTDACLMHNGLNWCMLAFFFFLLLLGTSVKCAKKRLGKNPTLVCRTVSTVSQLPFQSPLSSCPQLQRGGLRGLRRLCWLWGLRGLQQPLPTAAAAAQLSPSPAELPPCAKGQQESQREAEGKGTAREGEKSKYLACLVSGYRSSEFPELLHRKKTVHACLSESKYLARLVSGYHSPGFPYLLCRRKVVHARWSDRWLWV